MKINTVQDSLISLKKSLDKCTAVLSRALEPGEAKEKFNNLLDDSDKHYTKSEFVKDIISMNKELVGRGYENIEYFWNCEDSEIIEFLEEHKYLESGEVYE